MSATLVVTGLRRREQGVTRISLAVDITTQSIRYTYVVHD